MVLRTVGFMIREVGRPIRRDATSTLSRETVDQRHVIPDADPSRHPVNAASKPITDRWPRLRNRRWDQALSRHETGTGGLFRSTAARVRPSKPTAVADGGLRVNHTTITSPWNGTGRRRSPTRI